MAVVTEPFGIVVTKLEATPFTYKIALYGVAFDNSRMLNAIFVTLHALGTTTVFRNILLEEFPKPT
jgi:hypothetical protein